MQPTKPDVGSEAYAKQAVATAFANFIRDRMVVEKNPNVSRMNTMFAFRIKAADHLQYGIGAMIDEIIISDEKLEACYGNSGEVLAEVTLKMLQDYTDLQTSVWKRIKFVFTGLTLDGVRPERCKGECGQDHKHN